VSFICFSVLHLVPGDPVAMMLGTTAYEDEIQHYRELMGFNKPFLIQYFDWATNCLKGDFGFSLRYKVPVSELFIQRFPVTLYLSFFAFLFSTFLGVGTGIISSIRRGSFLDQALVVLATTGVCIPLFWLGIIGIYVFGLFLKWLPIQGFVMPNIDLLQSLRTSIMPVILLAIPSLAIIARQTRSSMLEVIRQDYIRTAWSKGLRERTVISKHALKNAAIPIITLLGIQVRIALGGSVLVEKVFNIAGMGRLLVDAAFNKDYFIVQGGVLLLGVLVSLANLLIDISYCWLDPRIRYN
jgi:peptide/nickel transport system permease protein